MFSDQRQTRVKVLRPVRAAGLMAEGSTRLAGAGAGFGTVGGGDGELGRGAATGAGAGAGFGAAGLGAAGTGAGAGAAAARGSRTVLPHLPQELAPPPA